MITHSKFHRTSRPNPGKFRLKNRASSTFAIAKILLSSLVLLILYGCEPAAEPSSQFLTRAGGHYSTPRLNETLQNKKLTFSARFNETAKYNLGDPALQSSKNKLLGFCDCNSLPHENSARFAWQWFNDRLEIYAYCYVNGERQEKFIGVVDINQYSKYELEIKDKQYVFRLNNEVPVYMHRGSTCSVGVYSKLWPYFGGHIAAPHDIIIDIKPIY